MVTQAGTALSRRMVSGNWVYGAQSSGDSESLMTSRRTAFASGSHRRVRVAEVSNDQAALVL